MGIANATPLALALATVPEAARRWCGAEPGEAALEAWRGWLAAPEFDAWRLSVTDLERDLIEVTEWLTGRRLVLTRAEWAASLPMDGHALCPHGSGYANNCDACSEAEIRAVTRTDAPEAGVKFDTGKTPWHLFDWGVLDDVAKVLAYGAAKYPSPDNWRRVEGWRWRYFRAGLEHLVAWWRGARIDSESGLPHLAHAITCLMFLAAKDNEAAL